jgi:hypothetical protein
MVALDLLLVKDVITTFPLLTEAPKQLGLEDCAVTVPPAQPTNSYGTLAVDAVNTTELAPNTKLLHAQLGALAYMSTKSEV